MLGVFDLKTWLHRDASRLDKLLLILATFDEPCEVKEIEMRASEAGFRISKNWNPSTILGRSKGLAISPNYSRRGVKGMVSLD